MAYKTPDERMKVSLRRSEVEATGMPLYTRFEDVPEGLVTKTSAKRMGRPVRVGETPVGYVLCRTWNGYLPVYDRRNEK